MALPILAAGLIGSAVISGISFVGGFATGTKANSLLATAALVGGAVFLIQRNLK